MCLAAGVLAFQCSWAQPKTALKRLLTTSDSLYTLSEKRVEEYCLKNSVAKRIVKNDNTYLMIDVSESGIPVFIKTDNAGAASTLGVYQLRQGGNLGLQLSGAEMRIGVWDGGRIRSTHVEFGGRAVPADGATENNTHATHVTGTILAAGVNASAQGMAPMAQASTFDFNNDLSEMTANATADQSTLIISNHSYGTVAGWERESNGTWTWHGDPAVSNTEDYKFGFYDNRSRLWDQLALNAPYYTIVKSAGNDRNDTGDGTRPPDGPYNSIPTYGNAKNIITVGAVSKVASYTGPQSVQMSSFSSWGPTDDGRIKPDLVAPGVNIFSTSAQSDEAYTSLNGTSMATPAVTGSLALLQQLYSQFNDGDYMRAATLKALVLHTAKEAGGSAGPDYQFGWGLLDVEAAARLILAKDDIKTQIIESSLNNNQTFEIELNPVDNKKITATLVWTDPAGTPPPVSLNPTTLMLVNDLDMRIVDEEGAQQFPWRLDPSSPSSPAARGDNFRDNVEKIEFDAPLPRKYFLRITHKNSLVNNSQAFSLILTYTSVDEMRQTYYWINGSGNWVNGSHWSLSSGGPAAGVVPTADDRVVFDGNSFSDNQQTVSFTGPQACYSFSWFSPFQAALNLNNHSLAVHDNVLILNNKLDVASPGTFILQGQPGKQYTFDSAQPQLDNISIQVNAPEATWSFQKNISFDNLVLEAGEVLMLARQLQINSITDTGTVEATLNVSGSTIETGPGFQLQLEKTTLVSNMHSTIIFSSEPLSTWTSQDDFFPGTLVLDDGSLRIDKANTLAKVSGNGKLHVNDAMHINELNLSAGSQLIVSGDAVLNLSDKLTLSSDPGNPIQIFNSGSANGTISITGNYKICLDHLEISNVDVVGAATVSAGPNSIIVESEGWLTAECDEILFADFEINYACKNSFLHTDNNSSGNIDSYMWYINDDLFSNEPDIIVQLGNENLISIKLEVKQGDVSRMYARDITILDNPMPTNHLVMSDTRLISFRTAERYQWLLNGSSIPGETQRFVHYTSAPGEYSVLTFSSGCNRLSEPFIISSTSSNPQPAVEFYPNPVTTDLWVSLTDEVIRCTAYDALGRPIDLEFARQDDNILISCSELPTGVYIIRLQTKKTGFNRPFRILKTSPH